MRSGRIIGLFVWLTFFGKVVGIAQVNVTDLADVTERNIKKEGRYINAALLSVSGKKQDAIKLLDTLRKESPGDAAIHFELAKLYRDTKDVMLAETHLTEAVRLAPNNIWVRIMEAEMEESQGKYRDAWQIVAKICLMAPKNPVYYQWKTDLHLQGNDLSGALQTLDEEALQIGFREKSVLRKSEILESAGKIQEAIKVLESLNDRFPNDKKYLRIIINVLHAQGKVSETLPYLKRILSIDPNDADAKLGIILIENKKLGKDDYLTTLTPLINNPDAPIDIKIKELLPFVNEQSLTGDTSLVKPIIRLCDQLIQIHPNEAKAHAIYADILKNSGNLEAAVRQYIKTLELSRKNFLVWEQLMFCLYNLKDYQQLKEISAEVLDYFPNQPISYWFAAEAYIFLNENQKALAMLEEASLIAGGNPEIESRIYSSKAMIALSNRDFNAAEVAALESYRISFAKYSIASELLGDIYFEKKQPELAKRYWMEAIESGGNKTLLQAKLKQIP
jgi:tetratricopeptide (TPR) repeat protein